MRLSGLLKLAATAPLGHLLVVLFSSAPAVAGLGEPEQQVVKVVLVGHDACRGMVELRLLHPEICTGLATVAVHAPRMQRDPVCVGNRGLSKLVLLVLVVAAAVRAAQLRDFMFLLDGVDCFPLGVVLVRVYGDAVRTPDVRKVVRRRCAVRVRCEHRVFNVAIEVLLVALVRLRIAPVAFVTVCVRSV